MMQKTNSFVRNSYKMCRSKNSLLDGQRAVVSLQLFPEKYNSWKFCIDNVFWMLKINSRNKLISAVWKWSVWKMCCMLGYKIKSHLCDEHRRKWRFLLQWSVHWRNMSPVESAHAPKLLCKPSCKLVQWCKGQTMGLHGNSCLPVLSRLAISTFCRILVIFVEKTALIM